MSKAPRECHFIVHIQFFFFFADFFFHRVSFGWKDSGVWLKEKRWKWRYRCREKGLRQPWWLHRVAWSALDPPDSRVKSGDLSQTKRNFAKSGMNWDIIKINFLLKIKVFFRCYNCGEFANHVASKCTMGPLPKRCHQCKSQDHLIADCPERPERGEKTTTETDPSIAQGDSH